MVVQTYTKTQNSDPQSDIRSLIATKFFLETTLSADGVLIGIKYDDSKLTETEKQKLATYLQNKGFTVA